MKPSRTTLAAAALAASLAAAMPAHAIDTVSVTVDFDALQAAALSNFGVAVADSYGPYAGTFSASAIALANDGLGAGVNGAYFSNAPSMGAVMYVDANAASTVLNAVNGYSFVNTLSFWFSFHAADPDASALVSVYAGADGSGQRLARAAVFENVTDAGCTDSPYCAWQKVTISFSGNAQSIVFGGAGGQIAYDDIGLITQVPEPESWALMGAGVLSLGFLARRRRQG